MRKRNILLSIAVAVGLAGFGAKTGLGQTVVYGPGYEPTYANPNYSQDPADLDARIDQLANNLNRARADLASAQQQLSDVLVRLDKNRQAGEDLSTKIRGVESTLAQTQAQLEAGASDLDSKRQLVAQVQQRVMAAQADLDRAAGPALTEFQNSPEFQAAVVKLQAAQKQLDATANTTLGELSTKPEYQNLQDRIRVAEAQLKNAQSAQPTNDADIAAANRNMADLKNARTAMETNAYQRNPKIVEQNDALAAADGALQEQRKGFEQRMAQLPQLAGVSAQLADARRTMDVAVTATKKADQELQQRATYHKQQVEWLNSAGTSMQAINNERAYLETQYNTLQNKTRDAQTRVDQMTVALADAQRQRGVAIAPREVLVERSVVVQRPVYVVPQPVYVLPPRVPCDNGYGYRPPAFIGTGFSIGAIFNWNNNDHDHGHGHNGNHNGNWNNGNNGNGHDWNNNGSNGHDNNHNGNGNGNNRRDNNQNNNRGGDRVIVERPRIDRDDDVRRNDQRPTNGPKIIEANTKGTAKDSDSKPTKTEARPVVVVRESAPKPEVRESAPPKQQVASSDKSSGDRRGDDRRSNSDDRRGNDDRRSSSNRNDSNSKGNSKR